MTLGIGPDDLASCVGCGLCLPHCPTWRVTGEEARSPRGRIATMRLVESGAAGLDVDAVESFESCLQCRGCEPACPSGVPFGSMIHATRVTLAATRGHSVPWWQRWALRALEHPRLVRAGVTLAAWGGRAHIVPGRFGTRAWPTGRAPLELPEAVAGPRVWLVRGCVMDAVQREVHQATIDVLAGSGFDVAVVGSGDGCCGALAAHAGLDDLATAQRDRMAARFPGDDLVVVDSAGCGAHLKEQPGELAGRVVDASELLARNPGRLPPPSVGWVRPTVAVSDPCHLRHVQRCHQATRDVLSRYADLVELDDDGLCCGAGGGFALARPDDAAGIRERKLAAIRRAGASKVTASNPGCALHLGAAGVSVSHPMEIIAAAMRCDEQGGTPNGR